MWRTLQRSPAAARPAAAVAGRNSSLIVARAVRPVSSRVFCLVARDRRSVAFHRPCGAASAAVLRRRLHSPAPLAHGRHHEVEEDDEDDTSFRPPVTAAEKERMEVECTSVTMQGVYANIGLAALKFAGGVAGNSMAMIADAVHSLSDLVTDGITLWAARLTHKPQDADHPYGHGKFEAIGSLTISATLAATAAGIGWSAFDSIQTIMNGGALGTPTGVALIAAIVSIAVKEGLYHATMRVGTRWNSKVVKANAWHHRSDSISTLVAMVGVVGAMVKLPILDPIAGLFVSGLIMKAALELGWDSLRDLTDENVDEKLQASVSSVLGSMRDEGVLSFHRLRGRTMGPFVLMDVHIRVDPTISVSAAHQIAERTRIRVRQKLPVIAEFMVHVDVASHHEHSSVFDDARPPPSDERPGQVQIFTPQQISEVVEEYRASRGATLRLVHEATEANNASSTSAHHHQHEAAPSSSSAMVAADAPSSTTADASSSSSSPSTSSSDATTSSGKPGLAKLASSIKSFIDLASSSPSSTDAPVEEAKMDLNALMRPQASIERDVRKVLADPHASYAPHLLGVSHLTCHWSPASKQLRVQLELAFTTDTLTIAQAGLVAKALEEALLKQIPDLHAVDMHLELTDAHIRKVKHEEAPRELTATATATPTTTRSK